MHTTELIQLMVNFVENQGFVVVSREISHNAIHCSRDDDKRDMKREDKKHIYSQCCPLTSQSHCEPNQKGLGGFCGQCSSVSSNECIIYKSLVCIVQINVPAEGTR